MIDNWFAFWETSCVIVCVGEKEASGSIKLEQLTSYHIYLGRIVLIHVISLVPTALGTWFLCLQLLTGIRITCLACFFTGLGLLPPDFANSEEEKSEGQ